MLLIVFMSYLLIAVFLLGKFFSLPFHTFTAPFMVAIVFAGVLDAFGNFFLVKSLQQTDLSVFGPINAYKAIIALVIGIFVLQEFPSSKGLLGVLIIFAGSYFLHFAKETRGWEPLKKLFTEPGVWYRFVSLFVFAVAAVYLKKAIVFSDPLTVLTLWAVVGTVTLFGTMLLQPAQFQVAKSIGALKKNALLFVPIFLLFAGVQVFSLYIFRYLLVGYSLALFQLSAVIAVIFGFVYFNEKNLWGRLVGSIIMIVGALLVLNA